MLWFKKKRSLTHDFEHIRDSLQGMLLAKVYREYYRIARDVSQGEILESVRAAIDADSENSTVDVLAIDVDGMLDRDFALFFDRLQNDGLLILDDYADTGNKRGQVALERYRRWDREGAATKLQEMTSFQRRQLLGKHLLTFRLVVRFEALGLLAKEALIGSTVFCRKTGDGAFRERWTSADGAAIEQSIVDDFMNCLHGNVVTAG